jgi:hypothetical protein
MVEQCWWELAFAPAPSFFVNRDRNESQLRNPIFGDLFQGFGPWNKEL